MNIDIKFLDILVDILIEFIVKEQSEKFRVMQVFNIKPLRLTNCSSLVLCKGWQLQPKLLPKSEVSINNQIVNGNVEWEKSC